MNVYSKLINCVCIKNSIYGAHRAHRTHTRCAQDSLERFRAIASSTAFSCLSSSSRRVDFFEFDADDEADLLEWFVVLSAAILLDADGEERFFAATSAAIIMIESENISNE